jgi:TonB family protein
MMNQQKTKKAGLLKYALILQLAIGLVLTCNAETILSKANKTVSATNDSVLKEMRKVSKNPVGTSNLTNCDEVVKTDIYQVVEKMPQYPGGEKALLDYIGSNLKYPTDAMKKGEQGRLIIRFVVNANGKVEKTEVLRGLTPSMNAEAIRVVNAMQDWMPGEQKGQKVSVYYTLPITFKLEGNSKPSGIMPVGKRVFLLDGITMPKDFDVKSIKPENIATVDVLKPDTEAKKVELIAKYGEDAANGVIFK